MNNLQYEKLLNSCTGNCSQEYCFLKMFFTKQHPQERVVIQLKCMEIAKWTWSAEVGLDIGWEATGMRWVNEGYAKAFSQVYSEDKDVLTVFQDTLKYKATMGSL